MAKELLRLQNIYKNFGNVKVLKDVSIQINTGEVVALIGDNGAGKSTLIKVITGVHRPTSGQVSFKGEQVVIKSVAQSRKMGIEAVYQERALCDQQELWRNIFAGREITNPFGFLDIKKQRKEAEKILRDYIGFTSKAITVDSTIMGLSGGEKQGVAFGRSLYFNSDLIVLDEPTMGLAPQLVAEIFNIVKELNQKEGVSILLAEQNTNIALKNSDYGYIIETGKVMLEGTAESLLNDDKVKELYLGISKKGRKNFRDVLKEESLNKKSN